MATVTIPCFSRLKAGIASKPATTRIATATAPATTPRMVVKASLKDMGMGIVAAAAATGILAESAMGMEVLMGGIDGSLAFIPGEFTVATGEEIVFKNNAVYPHNVVFDEESLPAGVDPATISMSEEDLLEAAGETYKVKLMEKV